MYKRFNIHEGLSPNEIAESIYKPTDNYYDDYYNLIEYLGGEKNITKVEAIDKNDYTEIDSKNNLANYYRVKVKKYEVTGFAKKENRIKCFNIYCDLFRIGQSIYIETIGVMDEFSKAWVQYFNSL